MDVSQNIELFQELIRCGGEISLWQYDGEGNLLSSNCPEAAIFDTAFSLSGSRARMLTYAAAQDAPVLLGTEMGLIWGAAFEKREGRFVRAYVLGRYSSPIPPSGKSRTDWRLTRVRKSLSPGNPALCRALPKCRFPSMSSSPATF